LNIFIYAGSFDPVTNGHLDIIKRSLVLCDKLIVAVGINERKRTAFTAEERMELLSETLKNEPKIEITSFSGLLTEYAKKCGASTIIKGLRAISDFEFEFQMAMVNKYLSSEVETLFMMTSNQYSYISSSAVKEIVRNGGGIDGLVPECIKDKILKRLGG
jgi:pantetheine-phosphate adenylyltransferase